MDKKTERSNKDKILRRLAKEFQEYGFARSKATYFVRKKKHIVEFFHFHKFTFAPEFRIHTCIRVLNDPRDWIALLGFHSDPYGRPNSPNGKKYNFRYHQKDETFDRCITNIVEYTKEVSLPWFQKWDNPKALIQSSDSPLGNDEKKALQEDLNGISEQEHIEKSLKLLKIA